MPPPARPEARRHDPAPALRALLPLAAMVACLFALALVGSLAGDAWFTHVVGGMASAALLGVLLMQTSTPRWVFAYGATAVAAFAGGALVARALPVDALLPALGVAAGALIAWRWLRSKRIEPSELRELRPFAWAVGAGVVAAPLCLVLADLVLGGMLHRDAAISASGLARIWVAGALGVVATLPLLLDWTRRSDPPDFPGDESKHGRPRLLWAVLAWLPVPLMLWWRQDLLVLGLLPLVAVAARIGPRATARLGLLTGAAIATVGFHPAAGHQMAPALMALAGCAALVAAQVIAILAAQGDRTAQSLAIAQNHLLAVTERGPILMATLGPDLRHQFANPGYLQWHGKTSAEVLGRSLQDVFGDSAATATVVATVRRAFGGQPQSQQLQLPDGRALDLRVEPRFAADGPVDGAHLLAQDAAWRSMHDRSLEAMLAGAFDPTLVLDSAGVVVRLNERMATLFGVSREALLGQSLASLLQPPAEAALTAA
ncbi:MAG: PAS domain-containing protein, partial [Luteimonas sp.]